MTIEPDKHADSIAQPEFTLCGMAFDAFETGDADGPIVFSKPGERVTCEDCLHVIAEIYREYTRTGWRRPDESGI